MTSRVQLDVWSDYVCPFCYLEVPVIDRLVNELGDRIEVRWRAFELRPLPVPTLPPDGEYLRDIWARAVYPMAKERGMTLRLPPVQPRSRLAFAAAEFAREQGKFDAIHRALFAAFFEHGDDIGQLDVLVRIGGQVGLPTAELRQSLDRGDYHELVIADEQLADQLAISGVPAMLIRPEGAALENAREITGAQPYEAVRAAVDDLLAIS